MTRSMEALLVPPNMASWFQRVVRPDLDRMARVFHGDQVRSEHGAQEDLLAIEDDQADQALRFEPGAPLLAIEDDQGDQVLGFEHGAPLLATEDDQALRFEHGA